MFKKTLLCIALGLASSAYAGSVSVYGIVDAGFDYTQTKYDTQAVINTKPASGAVKLNGLKLASGSHSHSRFGIKGEEVINPNLKVGFVLENGFSLMNGELDDHSKIFNREAMFYVDTAYGKLAAGRMGALSSGSGSFGVFGTLSNNFGGGWGKHLGLGKFGYVQDGVMDNTLTYQSPEFNGLTVYGQYSFNQQGDQAAKVAKNDRYLALGATYKRDKLTLVGVVDTIMYHNQPYEIREHSYVTGADTVSIKDTLIANRIALSVGGSYDFDVTKVYLSYQYAKHAKGAGVLTDKNFQTMYNEGEFANVASAAHPFASMITNVNKRIPMMIDNANGLDVHSLGIGLDTPVGNGVIKAHLGYMQAKTHNPYTGAHINGATFKVKAVGAALGYEHNLSKTTLLYTGVGFNRSKFELAGSANMFKFKLPFEARIKQTNYEAMLGLVHKF